MTLPDQQRQQYIEVKHMAHKVTIKDFHIDLEVKNKGIEFEVRIDDQHQGDLVLSKTGLEWCKGRTSVGNGTKVAWKDFIDWMQRT